MEKVNNKDLLVFAEVFYPEEFLINEVLFDWKGKGYEIEVLTRNPTYPYGKIYEGYRNSIISKNVVKGITVYRYHSMQGYRESVYVKIFNIIWNCCLSTIVALLKFRKKKNIFVYNTGPLTVALPAVLLHKFFGAKVTIWTQDLWPDFIYSYGFGKSKIAKKMIEAFVRFVYNNVDNIVVSSPAFSKRLCDFTNKESVFVPNWASKIFGSPTQSQTNKNSDLPMQFLFAGNIGKAQNLDNVIRGFALWRKRTQKEAVFNIYGDGSALDSLRSLVAQESIESVKLHGRVPLSKMPRVFEDNDVLILSLLSGDMFELYMPAKYAVYLTTQKPIFIISNGVVAEFTKEHKCGEVAKPDDIEMIADGFDNLYNLSNSERSMIARNAEKLTKSIFSSELSMEKLESLVFK